MFIRNTDREKNKQGPSRGGMRPRCPLRRQLVVFAQSFIPRQSSEWHLSSPSVSHTSDTTLEAAPLGSPMALSYRPHIVTIGLSLTVFAQRRPVTHRQTDHGKGV